MNIKIEHVAYWVEDLEKVKSFYLDHFKASASELYHNRKKGFRSYFLTLGDGARIEIMNMVDKRVSPEKGHTLGLAHIALSLGSKEEVDRMTTYFSGKGIEIVGLPRTTGDGYYESVVADPEGNLIELTV